MSTTKVKKFKILAGLHDDGTRKTPYGPGEVCASTQDLCKKFNQFGAEKFMQVDDATPVSPEPNPDYAGDAAAPTPDLKLREGDLDTLEAMTFEELKQFAASEEIPLPKNCKTKDEALKALREAMAVAK